jgi:NADPH-dependent 2,4-dienoyl-CoA reductase/sulfur reductase-like enzyme/CxxC motif-containing protein
MKTIKVDLAIVGGGPAGLAAAIEGKKAGIARVVIIERDEQLGGLLYQCIHNGFGLQYFGSDLSGPEYACRFLELLQKYQVDVYLESMVIGITPEKEITMVNSGDGLVKINAKAIVLAMGCRERARGAINIAGSRPAGIFTAGSAQRLINVEGYFPGKRIVILGSGDIGMIMARRVTLENAKVEAVVELLPYIGGLVRNECQCLRDFNIPVYLSHTVSKIHGNERIEGVTIAKVDESLRIIPGTEKEIACDTLLLSVGLIPENELSKTAGIELCPTIGGPVVDENMQTSIPGIFAAGNVVHVHDLVDYVTLGGEKAGNAAARYIQGKLNLRGRRIRLAKGANIRYVVPRYINGDSDVSLYMRVTIPAAEATLNIGGGLVVKELKKAKPSEMLKIDIPAAKLKAFKGEELKIECVIKKTDDTLQDNAARDGREIICLICPMACRGQVVLNRAGGIEKCLNFRCKRGEEFAIKELKNPERVLTGTIRTGDPAQPLLPFRVSKPIARKLLQRCMAELADIEITKPVKTGEVIVPDIMGSGSDIIAALDYPFKKSF